MTIIIANDHMHECFAVDMAWYSGEKDLKSVFSAKLDLELLKTPFDLVYK